MIDIVAERRGLRWDADTHRWTRREALAVASAAVATATAPASVRAEPVRDDPLAWNPATHSFTPVNSSLYDAADAGVTFDGVTDDYEKWHALITSIGTAQAEITTGPGNSVIGTNLTIPANIAINYVNGATLAPKTGVTVTHAGNPKAGPYKIFAGAGTVVGVAGCCAEVYAEWWGANGIDAATDTAAFQNAIKFVLGTGNPATTTRTPVAPLQMLARTYLINADLNIVGTQGFKLRGAGRGLSILQATGTGFTSTVLNIDGAFGDSFSDFTIIGDGTEKAGAAALPNGIVLQWSAAAQRSTSQNQFRAVEIRNLNFVNGINLAGHNQVDGTGIYDTLVAGGGATDPTLWQAGIVAGDGTSGNNLNHNIYNSSVSGCKYGALAQQSNFSWYGGEPGSNGVDFQVTNPAGWVTINGINSQGSQRLVAGSLSSGPTMLSIRDTVYQGNAINADGYWMNLVGHGPVLLENVLIDDCAAVVPIAYLEGQGNIEQLTAINVTQANTPAAGLKIGAGNIGQVVAVNYTQTDASNVVVKVTTQWRNNVGAQAAPPAIAASTVAVANPYPYTCSVYVSGGTVSAIAVNAVTTGLTSGLVRVPVGATITLTYSVAPTWQWLGD